MHWASRVKFFFSGSKPTLTERSRLKKFIVSLLKQEGKRLDSINFIFTNDKLIYKINKRYLGHDHYTDIVTFDLGAANQPVLAEVYISCDRVRENARTNDTSFKEELHRVVFHGVLHLAGYKDKTEKQSKEIRKKENHYLRQYFG